MQPVPARKFLRPSLVVWTVSIQTTWSSLSRLRCASGTAIPLQSKGSSLCTPLLGASSNLIRSVLYCVRPQSTTVLPAVLYLKLQSTFHTPGLALSIRHHLQGHMRCMTCGTHAKGQFTLIATPPQCFRWVQRYLSQQVNNCSLPGHSAIPAPPCMRHTANAAAWCATVHVTTKATRTLIAL
jgi:hypothetical protein